MLNLVKIILIPFSFLYGIIIRGRNYLFDKEFFKIRKVDATIVSIGNLTVGGSGKTPAVIFVAKLLIGAGEKVGILSRGYGRKTRGYYLVSDESKIVANVDESGDEMYLAAQECKAPTAVSEKRIEGAQKLTSQFGLQTVVLDDAFQHRWIHRDLDIVMFDQRFLTDPKPFEQGLLPSGMMREPFYALKRADAIIINRKFSEKKDIPGNIQSYMNDKPLFYGCYEAQGFYDVKSNHYYDLKEFQGQKSLVVCGIAKPYSFIRILQDNSIETNNQILFPDHKDYTFKEIQNIRRRFYDTNSYSVLTTQKDAVKLTRFSNELDDIDIYFLKIEFKIENESEFKKFIIKKTN